jgi:membrane-anchored glycerophosphoryl diester phosphodiesterase (GDPDase)
MWMILFGFVAIVPGLYLSARLCWVPQCVLYENAGALQAIQWSWDRTRGQVWLIFLSFVLPLIVLILVAISTGRAVELWSLVVPASGLIAGLAEQTVWLTILAGAVLVGVTNTMLYLRTVLEHEPFAGLPRR